MSYKITQTNQMERTISEAVEMTNTILKNWGLKCRAKESDFSDYFKYSEKMEFTNDHAVSAANSIQEDFEDGQNYASEMSDMGLES